MASDESGKAVIVDPGCYDENEISVLTSYIAGSGLQIEKILLTHGHFDHIFGVSALAERYDVAGGQGDTGEQRDILQEIRPRST